MSNQALNHVWNTSKAVGAAFTLLLAIADSANEKTADCFMGVSTLAKKARLSERYIPTLTQQLETLGELIVYPFEGVPTAHGRTNRYVVPGLEGAMYTAFPKRERKGGRPKRDETSSSQEMKPVHPIGSEKTIDFIPRDETSSSQEMKPVHLYPKVEPKVEPKEQELSPTVDIPDLPMPVMDTSQPSEAGEVQSDPTPFQEESVGNGSAEKPTTPDAVTPPSPAPEPPKRKKNALQEAVAYALDMRPGGHVGKIGAMLTHAAGSDGKWALKLDDGPMTPAEICAWGEWMRAKDGYEEYKPQKAQTIIDSAALFRAEKSYEMWLKKGELRLGLLLNTIIHEFVPKPGQFVTLPETPVSSDEAVDLDKEIGGLWNVFTNHAAKNTPKDQAYFEAQREVIAKQRSAYK
jgi:hypothetical protein